jgi:hypothetical protein
MMNILAALKGGAFAGCLGSIPKMGAFPFGLVEQKLPVNRVN